VRYRRWLRRTAYASSAALALAVITGIVLRVFLHGPALADFVSSTINGGIRGRVVVESIDWPLSSLPAAMTGGWIPVEARGLTVYDERGVLVLSAKRATAEIETLALARGPRFHFRNISIPADAEGYALIEEIPEDDFQGYIDLTVVSLIGAFMPKRSAALYAGWAASAGSPFTLDSYEVAGVTMDFRFGSAFSAHVEGIEGRGWLVSNPLDPLDKHLYYSLAPSAKSAHLTMGPLTADVRELSVDRLAQLPEKWPRSSNPSSLRWSARATTESGAQVALVGAMLDHWATVHGGDYRIDLEVAHAGDLMAGWTAGVGRGGELEVRLRLDGPRLAPRLGVDLTGLALDPSVAQSLHPGAVELPIAIPTAHLELDLATGKGALERTIAEVGGGAVSASARLSLHPLSVELEADIPRPVDLRPVLPTALVRLVGPPTLSGSLHLFATPDLQDLDRLDLRLGALQVTGHVLHRRAQGTIQVDNLGLALGQSRVTVAGDIEPGADGRAYNLSIRGASADLNRWLRSLGVPPLAHSAAGNAHISGTAAHPAVSAELSLGGVPVLGRASTHLAYENGEVRVSRAHATSLGGEIKGDARIRLDDRPTIVSASASGKGLDLSKLPVVGRLLTGTGALSMRTSGRLPNVDAAVDIDLTGWTFAGESYEDAKIAARSSRDGSKSLQTHLSRRRGGLLDLAAVVNRKNDLSGAVSMRKLPLESLTAVQSSKDPIFGAAVDAELQLGGSISRPTADGQVSLLGSWFRSSFLGSASLELESRPDGRLGFSGRFLQDAVVVTGTLDTHAPFALEIEADLRRVEIDRFWPRLQKDWDARGWMSGKLTWRGTLLEAADHKPQLDLALTEAMLIVDSENASGRPAPIRLQTRSPLRLTVVGDDFRIRDKVLIEGPAGSFSIAGRGSLEALDLDVEGALAVQLLEPYVRSKFEELDGELTARAKLSGSLSDPRVTGSLVLRNISIKPAGQDTSVRVPTGKIEFTNDQLSLTGISLVVEDEFSNESAELTIRGGVKLADFQPRLWAVQIDGQLAGKMLLVFAPEAFSAASGVADLSIALLGTGTTPDIDGRIEFSDENPLTLVPRGLRRELTMTQGAMAFTEQLVELEQVRGWFDDEGRITDVTGEVELRNWRPTEIDVTVSARDVPFRVPQELELALNVYGARVTGSLVDGLEIGGRVEIVDGRYIRKMKQALDFIRPERTVETGPSILETQPLIANAKLSLDVSSRALFVRNNVANLELSGDLTITGTPAKPRLDGLVRVEQGTFKFQGIRPNFTRTSGTLWFENHKAFPEQTPVLNIRSESDYRDLNGQDHLIVLELNGPLSNLLWDLKTGAGLNKAQTLNLTLFGRTLDDTRAALGDEPVARVGEYAGLRSTTELDSGGFVIADEFAKSLSGDLLSSLVADPIKNLTNIDVVKLGLGATGSINLYLEEGFTRSLRGIGEYERSSRGSTLSGRAQYRITDRISGDYEYLRKQYDDDAEVDVARHRLKFTYRLPIIP